MSDSQQFTDREMRFIAAMHKHDECGMKIDMVALSTELGIAKSSASSVKCAIKKKLTAYLDGTSSSSSARVRKRSTSTTVKRGSTGAGRGAARGRGGRGGRTRKCSTAGKASGSTKNEAIALDADDDDKQEEADPFVESKPTISTKTRPSETLSNEKDEIPVVKYKLGHSTKTGPIENPSNDDDQEDQIETSKAFEWDNAHDPFISIDTLNNKADEEEGKDAELLETYDQDVVEWVARNAGIW